MSDIITKEKPTMPEQAEIGAVKKLLSQKVLRLYHGSKDKDLKPDFAFDNANNDYGKGLYTTPEIELGREWAYSSYTHGDKGYLYTYEIDISDLKVLDLTRLDSMHWLAELLYNRKIDLSGREALQDTIGEIIKKYKLDTDEYDIIVGYRANDSYFTYAIDFVSGAIYRDTLETALRNGNLGIQVFIKSKKAFDLLKAVGNAEEVDDRYATFYRNRDKEAREKYMADRKNQTSRIKQRVFDFL